MDKSSLTDDIKNKAYSIGFSFCTITSASSKVSVSQYQYALDNNYCAEMNWLRENLEVRSNPQLLMPEAQSIIICGLHYYQASPVREGKIATYALGRDYHKVIASMLKELSAYIETNGGRSKYFVDTAPLMEKTLAQLSGAGWIGKQSLLIHNEFGPYCFLGEVITTLSLQVDNRTDNLCGDCSQCIDSCPTGAIISPCVVDANRCISYHTIENKGVIPKNIAVLLGEKLYGCDNCLDSCPWHTKTKATQVSDFKPREYPPLRELLQITENEFSSIFAGSPIHRIKLRMLQRNAIAVLGNIGNKTDIELLSKYAMLQDEILAEQAKWAIEEIMKRT